MYKVIRYLLLVSMCFAVCVCSSSAILASQDLEIIIIDVGQGNSALIISPNGQTMLIDAGETGQVSAVFKALNARGIEKIDYLIATHPHIDHIDGLIDILEAYKVGKILEPGKIINAGVYQSFILEAKKRDIPIVTAREGLSFYLGPVKIDILSPADPLPEDIDDCSIVLGLKYASFAALFTGDIGSGVENNLVLKGKVNQVTLLSVAHHGSITSSSEAFLNKALPKYAVISVGKDNGYGHPSAFVLMRLGVIGASILRTDIHGTVTFKTDGTRTSVTNEKNKVQVNQNYTPPQFLYVASKNSDVFHYSTCSSVPTIKAENLIKFKDRAEAIASGRHPCTLCKP